MSNTKPKYSDKDIIRAIKGGYTAKGKDGKLVDVKSSGGIISTIAARLGCDWHTVKIAIQQRSKVAQAYYDECESVKDAAESVVLENIQQKNSEDAKWYLMRKARDRGYGTTVALKEIDYSIFTLEELERISKGESEEAVHADAIKRITASAGTG